VGDQELPLISSPFCLCSFPYSNRFSVHSTHGLPQRVAGGAGGGGRVRYSFEPLANKHSNKLVESEYSPDYISHTSCPTDDSETLASSGRACQAVSDLDDGTKG
jgi:hypothetical protein